MHLIFKHNNKQKVFAIIIILLSSVNLFSKGSDTKVTFSGSNYLESRYGYKPRFHGFYEEQDFFWDGEYRIQPWYYIRNIFNMNIGVNNFSFQGRFLVDAPSMGYHPEDVQWYREIFDKRAFSYNGEILSITVGHFMTQFGRGLTINLKEDPLVELSTVMDGVLIESEFNLGSLRAFVGRDLGIENKNLDFKEEYEEGNNTFGVNGELFPFTNINALSILSSSSFGAGVVNYRRGVDNLDTIIDIDETIDTDTTYDTIVKYVQPRTNIVVPAFFTNFSIGPVNLYGEYARSITLKHEYIDSLNKESVLEKDKGFATFIELSGAIGKFYLRGEYKNYFFDYIKEKGISTNSIAGSTLYKYTDPPWARYKHLWHLLAKRTLLPYIQDELGYNFEVSWTPGDNTQIFINGNFGGHHLEKSKDSSNTEYSFFNFKKEKDLKFGEGGSYYDIYAELTQNINDLLKLKLGIDYGQIDPKHVNILYRTIAGRLDIGPFKDKHLFGLQGELQLNRYKHLAEKDYGKLKEMITDYYPENEINPNDLTHSDSTRLHKYYKSMSDDKKTIRYDEALNWLCELSYKFSSVLKLHGIAEFETQIGNGYEKNGDYFLYNDLVVDKLIQSKSRVFINGGITITPVPKHSFTFEGGSYSRVKICNMGVCTIIPAFKGVKFTINSTF